MNMPICEICAKSGFLCARCEEKWKKGEITQTDVDISRFLYKLNKKAMIPDIDFEKSIELNGFVLLIVDGGIGQLIGKGGKIIRMISEQIGKKIRIVEKGSLREMVQDLVFPARVYGINILYTPEQDEYSVIIPREDGRKILMPEETLKKAMHLLFNKKVNISFS